MALMDGKCCIVTGGAGSIGLASAALLLSEGAKVMLVDRSQGDLDQAAAGLDGGDVLTLPPMSPMPWTRKDTSARRWRRGANWMCCLATPG